MITGETIKAKGRALKNEKTVRILKSAGYLVLGFLFSLGSVLGELHPFGIAVTAVTKRKYLVFTLLGAAAGTLTQGVNENSVRYLTAIALAALGALGISVFERTAQPAFPMAVAFVASLATGTVLLLRSDLYLYRILLTVGEAILTCGSTYFFHKALHANYRRLRLAALPMNELTCMVVSASLLLMNLARFRVGSLSPVRVVAVLAVLTALRYFGSKWGITAALALGFALSIGDGELLYLTGAYAFSALTAGLFCGAGSLAVCLSFLCSVAFFTVASDTREAVAVLTETGIACVILLLFPAGLSEKLEDKGINAAHTPSDGSLRQSLVLKLRFASAAMKAISENVEQVREKINAITRRDNENEREQIGEEMYLRRELILEKTNQLRMVASDQFFSIADMLEELAFEFDETEVFDASASSKIRRLLAEHDIYPLHISAIEDKSARMRVEILTDKDTRGLDNPLLKREIGKICHRYFENGSITYFKDETMLSFSERPCYKLAVGFAQYSAEGALCGDTLKIVNDSKGHTILIISDGMGTGSRAALDGAMGAGLLARLINAGFGFDSALKVVNCALLVKSNDESLATLDIADIDLFTGRCELLKAGAPASYLLKGTAITRCELSSMPAGILRGIEFAKKTAVLQLSDSLLMLSDGITELGSEWLEATLPVTATLSAQESADYILKEAVNASADRKKDDMSIICARLERN